MAEGGRLEFTDFTEWAQACRDAGLELYGTTRGSEAMISSEEGVLKGFWEYGTQKGWLERWLDTKLSRRSIPG